jgi:PelA/Pel-15E family pectate lyase
MLSSGVQAKVVGRSTGAESITAARISRLPGKERSAWMAYLERSERQMTADKAALAAELKPGQEAPPLPPEGRGLTLEHGAEYWGTTEARHEADVMVSFQTPAGGWSKNMSMSGALRLPGQPYAPDNLNRYPSVDDFDAPRDPRWNYVGTLDNDATNTELHFLALVAAKAPGKEGDGYRASFVKGIRYELAAQFPNGGWPQVWPLEGGYHDAITFNDNAVTETATLMTAVAKGEGEYGFVPKELRRQAAESARRALGCILATQVEVGGKKTVWPQQADALTLQPVSGRNYEPAALSSGESAAILMYLMALPEPSAAVREAVEAGVMWLKSTAIYGEVWAGGRGTPGGRKLTATAGAGPIWARFYSMETGKPVFGDRDKSLHDDVTELSAERRNGYAWYSGGPAKALAAYAGWSGAATGKAGD